MLIAQVLSLSIIYLPLGPPQICIDLIKLIPEETDCVVSLQQRQGNRVAGVATLPVVRMGWEKKLP